MADTPNSNSTPETSSMTPATLDESPLAQIATRASSEILEHQHGDRAAAMACFVNSP